MNNTYVTRLDELKQIVESKEAEVQKAKDDLNAEKRRVAQNLVDEIIEEYGEDFLLQIEAVLSNRRNKGIMTSMPKLNAGRNNYLS